MTTNEDSSNTEVADLPKIRSQKVQKFTKVLKYLSAHYAFRYNLELKEMTYHNSVDNKFILIEDHHFSDIKNDLIFADLDISRENLMDLIFHKDVCVRVSPLREYFLDLPKWDKSTDYIKILLEQIYLKNEEERQVFVETFRKWFIGVVACFFSENAVNQQCFVLVGDQSGQMKTTFLNSLVPEHLRMDYLYTGTFNFEDVDDKKKLAQKLIINIDEMATLTRTDEKILKTVLTSVKFEGRLKYARFDTKKKRIASFCGSTNDRKFLTDETGNRRYLVFEVKRIMMNNDSKLLKMAYSQAFALYKDGYKYWFDKDDIMTINARNDNFRRISNEENLVMEFLQVPTAEQEKNILTPNLKHWSTTRINTYLIDKVGHLNVNETTIKRLEEVLHKAGFLYKSRRVTGHRNPIKCWAVITIDEPVDENMANSMQNGDYDII